jgi:hypothetical protein
MAKYTHQDFDKILSRTRPEIRRIIGAIDRLLERENKQRPM